VERMRNNPCGSGHSLPVRTGSVPIPLNTERAQHKAQSFGQNLQA
jgi:hypothetical protein